MSVPQENNWSTLLAAGLTIGGFVLANKVVNYTPDESRPPQALPTHYATDAEELDVQIENDKPKLKALNLFNAFYHASWDKAEYEKQLAALTPLGKAYVELHIAKCNHERHKTGESKKVYFSASNKVNALGGQPF